MLQLTSFSQIKKGEYFRFQNKTKVYVFNGKIRGSGFEYYDFNDVNNFHYTKTNREIEVGFDF